MLPFEGPAAQGHSISQAQGGNRGHPLGSDCLIKEAIYKGVAACRESREEPVRGWGQTPRPEGVREGCGYGFQMAQSPTDVVTAPTTRGRSVEGGPGGQAEVARAHQR